MAGNTLEYIYTELQLTHSDHASPLLTLTRLSNTRMQISLLNCDPFASPLGAASRLLERVVSLTVGCGRPLYDSDA